jgi:hypothetical protein
MCVSVFFIARQAENSLIATQQRKFYKQVTHSDGDRNVRSQTVEQKFTIPFKSHTLKVEAR